MSLAPDVFPEPSGPQRVAVVVAHPDDEVLWSGGLLLSRPEWSVFILALCRGKDPDRAPRFQRALLCLEADGAMADLDDGADQADLPGDLVEDTILALLPRGPYDLLLTHGPDGEYTRHKRHQETALGCQAVLGRGLAADRLWQFAYEDQGGARLPAPRPGATLKLPLDESLWSRKYALMTQIYGFTPASWEARTTPRTEAFMCYRRHDGSPS